MTTPKHFDCGRIDCVTANRKTVLSKAACEAPGNAARNKQARLSRPPAPIAQSVAGLHHLAERTGEHVGRSDE
jgi:hypothetical protein